MEYKKGDLVMCIKTWGGWKEGTIHTITDVADWITLDHRVVGIGRDCFDKYFGIVKVPEDNKKGVRKLFAKVDELEKELVELRCRVDGVETSMAPKHSIKDVFFYNYSADKITDKELTEHFIEWMNKVGKSHGIGVFRVKDAVRKYLGV